MKKLIYVEMVLGILLLAAFTIPMSGTRTADMGTQMQIMLAKQLPQPPALAFRYSIFRTAPLEVAKVFGRTPGCADADTDLIQATANAAINAGLDPAIAAATVGVESSCNTLAISTHGAVGLMGIVPKIWREKFDFEGQINLFNREDNLLVGARIEAGLIQQYGTNEGIHHYNGMGVDCSGCDLNYVSKILKLAGK